MSRAADVARQAIEGNAAARTSLLCSPGSEQIHETIRRDGQMEDLESIGAMVLANACGPCIGQWRRDDLEPGVPNSIITSYNRNFPKRNDGNPDTLAFIASPEIVVAYALAGTLEFNPLTDEIEGKDGQRFVLEAPASAPEVPERGFIFSREGYQDPPEERGKVEVAIAPDSERLQLLEPFAPWDGNDFEKLPLLLKAKGKCTTDHISPAGPWLRFRGHLDKISDNAFIGAGNAFTGETGTGLDQLSQETGVAFAKIARHYKAQGLQWVVVGDENYGEGSSREHAAMSPRHLGCATVIARSFARIAQTNLKKQGVLPLRFSDPALFDKVQEADRVSVQGLSELAPGRALRVTFHHADGSEDSGEVSHTLNEDQIAWFEAGSALNILARES